MRNKVRYSVLILGLLAMVIGLSACGYVSTRGDGVNDVPHSADWGFTNCLVCHSGGDLAVPTNPNHASYTIDQCLLLPGACHSLASDLPTFTPDYTPPPTTTTTKPPTTTTTQPPTTTTAESPGPLSLPQHAGFTPALVAMCMTCHGPEGEDPNPEDHADYANNSCFDPGCHEAP